MYRAGVLSEFGVDLQNRGAFCGFRVQRAELGCILWIRGAACRVEVYSAELGGSCRTEVLCAESSAGYSQDGFWKTPWPWAKSTAAETNRIQVPGHRGDNGQGRKCVQTLSWAQSLSGAPLNTVSSKTKGADARRLTTHTA